MPKYYLIVDLEATCCDEGSINPYQMEIIEIGAVMVDASTKELVSEFETFVKPLRTPELTPFCTKLTSITQEDVNNAPTFPEAVKNFKIWLYQFYDFVFCSWGDYDKKQLQQDCFHHNIAMPITAQHINIKKEFSKKQGMSKKLGMAEALKHVNLELIGTHHRGIDDVRNMARLIPYIFE